MSFPRKLSPVEKPVSTCPRSSQVVNRGHVSKYNSYYQFIMEAEGMKNHDIRIMHDQQALSPVSYTRGFSMENLQLDLEHLVAMNSLSSSMISFPVRFVINPGCSTFSPVIEPGLKLYLHFPLPVQRDQNLFPSCAFVGYTVQISPWSRHGDLSERKERHAEQQNCKV
jgi:hypothetical protein